MSSILSDGPPERLFSAVDDAVKGENVMKPSDNSEFGKYRPEAEQIDNTKNFPTGFKPIGSLLL